MDYNINSGIYAIVNNVNGKMYIGQSINLDSRKSNHFKALESNKHYNIYLQKSFDKYGKSAFEFMVIEHCDKEMLNEIESKYINKFDTMNKDKGYNLRSGGGVNYLSEVSKKKISETRKKRILSGDIKTIGVPCTKERIEKIKIGLMEYWDCKEKRIERSKAKTTIDLQLIAKIKDELRFTNKSQKEIAEYFGVSKNIIGNLCNLRSHSYIKPEHNEYLVFRINSKVNNGNMNKEIQKSRDSLRKNKLIISMYRDGISYRKISENAGIHPRNVIRRIKEIKTIHDDRCRLNSINKSFLKRDSLIRTLYKMDKNTVQISNILNVSRTTIASALKYKTTLFNDVSETRGRFDFKKKVIG